jgi:tetratricopeptide (TPR) repeat protein
MNDVASCFNDAGKLDLAIPLHEEILKLRKIKLGLDHPDTLTSMSNLAAAYHSAGKLDLALPLCLETLRLTKTKLGADDPATLASMNNLAEVYEDAGKLDLALPLFEETLRLTKAKLGSDHPHTLAVMNNLASGYKVAGKLDLALPLMEETLRQIRAKLGADHPLTLGAMHNLATSYGEAGKLDIALPLHEEAAAGFEKRGFQLEHSGQIVNNLCICCELMKRFPEAETWRRKWLTVLKEQGKSESPDYAAALATLGLNLLEQSKWSDAEVVFHECIALRERLEPDAWTTFNAKSLLGAALLGQKKYSDAEPLLLAGYQGMKQRESKIPKEVKVRLAQALERLVQLYEATGKLNEAAKGRKEIEALQAAEKPPVKP